MELLVRLIDKAGAEDASKRGDVICVCDDGWAWSADERTNPAWIIIKTVQLVDGDRLQMLRQMEPGSIIGHFRRREYFLDFAQAPDPTRFAYPRVQESVTMLRVRILQMLTAKPPLA